MESTIQGVEDSLISSLIYKLGHSSNYILNRRSVQLFPAGGNQYGPTGVRVIKFMLSGHDWLDPGTLRVSFKLQNNTNGAMRLLNYNPATFFRRLTVRAGGQTIEDIDYYNRISNMMSKLQPTDRRYNDMNESFPLQEIGADPAVIGYNLLNRSPVMRQGESITLMMPLLSGLFSCGKLLPLRYLQNLQIDLELVVNYLDAACECHQENVQWEISEAKIVVDVVQLDSQLENEFTNMLLNGKSIPISYSSFVHQVSNVGTTDAPAVAIARAFTRLKCAYVTLYRNVHEFDDIAAAAANGGAGDANVGFTNAPALALPFREATFFYHPQFLYPGLDRATLDKGPDGVDQRIQCATLRTAMTGYYTYNPRCQVHMQIQLGSQLYPERWIENSQESYYFLRKAIGCHELGNTYNISIPNREYRSHSFSQAISFEKSPGTAFSGANTRTGDLLLIKMRNLQHIHLDGTYVQAAGANPTFAEFIHVTLEYDAVLNIMDAGVSVFD